MSNDQKKTKEDSLWLALKLAWDLGYIIAIPAAVFGFGGAYLDKYEGTSPLFLLLGLAAALGLSSIGVKRIVKKIIR
ncbi:AtpZ/AtpI family protein [Candidatus Peregrinibacteria bacterium]|nr:AtpZ/AtpI family protein [Candidatus Peregrinibacteria bacterium]MBI3816404.1 AtpZ/AtpI family protein [Candidatus Peregrinibacteria bacterium]